MWRYLIAIVLLAHGIGHIMPFMAAWTPQISKVGLSNAPWIFSGGVGVGSPIGQVFGLLGLVVLIGFGASALSLVAHCNYRGSSHLHRDHCAVVQYLANGEHDRSAARRCGCSCRAASAVGTTARSRSLRV